MINHVQSRFGAFAIHFLASSCVFFLFLYFVLVWWYPEPYLSLEGGWFIIGMIVLVDVILGPTLTLIVFKPGKKGLVFDLSLIAAVQLCALVYGISVIYQERPQFLAFSVDRFVIASSKDVEQGKFRYPALLHTSQHGPLPVYAELPADPVEKTRLMQEVFAGKPDLDFRAEYYEPLQQHLPDLFSRSKTIADFRGKSAENRQKIDQFIADHCGAVDQCAYFPVVGKETDMMLVLQRRSGRIIGAMDIDPWTAAKTYKQANHVTGPAAEAQKNG